MSLNATELNFPPPNDVIRPRPLRPTSLFVTYDIVAFRDVAFDAKIAVGGRFLVRSVYQLIPTVKMETRHPVVAIFPFIGIFKTLFRKFSSGHRSTCCVQIL